MGTTKINTITILLAALALAATELTAGKLLALTDQFSYKYLGLIRIIESILLILIIFWSKNGLASIGLNRSRIHAGILTGIRWSMAFGLLAFLGGAILYLSKNNPLGLIKINLPQAKNELILFFIVGGLIAPVAEELFFRGFLFGYFSQWGVPAAIALSSFIFVIFHAQGGLIQAVGGIVFALAYHFSQSLVAPIIIHCTGNLALFFISFMVQTIAV